MDQNTKGTPMKMLENFNELADDLKKIPLSPSPTDEIIPHVGLEICLSGEDWIPSSMLLWRSWTGLRRVWCMEYHGPVFSFESPERTPFTGRRVCGCKICQEHVECKYRHN